MSYPKDELAAPPAARADPRSFEVARLWIADDRPHVALRTDVWDDPAAWGLLLADLARHVARAYHQASGHEPEAVLERVPAGFRAELESPTDEGSGAVG